MRSVSFLVLLVVALVQPMLAADDDFLSRVEHHYADSNGVKIHYAALGQGPLVVMIHGFPDFWYSWRDQMEVISEDFRVVAVDQRGYNLSGQPEGVENYDMRFLIGDIAAVIKDAGYEKAAIVGHDWGGAVAWAFAMYMPQMTDRLVILNLPHPNGMARELANNPEQQANSQYARDFQTKSASDPDVFFGMPMTPQTLSGWVTDESAKQIYVEAFERSYFDGMLAYYKRNYPGATGGSPPPPAAPVKMPVLEFHGLEDTALNSDGLNNTWDWLEKDLTLVTIPGAGHFVQQDASELVTKTMHWWLSRDQ